MEQALTQLAVKIQFGDSTSCDKMMWTIILPEEADIMIANIYDLDNLRISLDYITKSFTKLS